MDGILALGHFCESHGPCVVLCTQKYPEEPEQAPHTLTVPWCEACQSLQLDQALISREEKVCYVTTRTPLQQDAAFLLKQATVRSLSCEQDGSVYFGDNERGHVFSHTFMVHDSLARGFQRKYTILMLMRDKIMLLNLWPTLIKHIKEIGRQLKESSVKVNEEEQVQKPQRALRQAHGSPASAGRSLSQLIGKPAIYAHLHLWFAWLLGCKIAVERPFTNTALLPIPKPFSFLRTLYQDMGEVIFRQVCSLLVTGIPIHSDDTVLLAALYSLLPDDKWRLKMRTDYYCTIYKQGNGKWQLDTNAVLLGSLSTFQKSVERALSDTRISESTLEPLLTSILMHWQHTARVLTWCPTFDIKLLQSFNVQKYDVPLLVFWTGQYVDCADKHKSIVNTLNGIFCFFSNVCV